MVSQAPFSSFLFLEKGLLLGWAELAKEAGMASLLCCLVLKSQVHAMVPGFSTWLLGTKLRSATKQIRSVIVYLPFIFLKIFNPFVHLKLT